MRPHSADPRGGLSALWRALGVRRGFVILTISAALIALGAWQALSYLHYPDPTDRVAPNDNVDVRLVARVPPDSVLKSLPPSFLGQSFGGHQVAWLVDGSAGMAPYYAEVTSLIATSMSLMQPDRRFGLYLAGEQAADSLPLTGANPKAAETARGVMRRFRTGGHVDLVAAFEHVAAWKPDTIFLVLAQPTQDAARDEMIRQARATKIVVHVAAVGEQPYFGWRSLAEGTNGQLIPLNARELQVWIDRVMRPAPVTLPRPLAPVDANTNRGPID